jgi:PAS domain S-box-containing protein
MENINHLLLVNSIDEDRALLRQLLEPLNLQITEVGSGLEAVEALQKDRFELVVTAISIGEFDSWRLARFIRSGICQGGRTLPIIIVTRAWCERITEITARDFGINFLLSFENRDQLPDAVRHCLSTSPASLGKRTILVVEDHSDNAQLVEKILQNRFEVELASDGAAGLEAWKKRRHDLVLLDIMLPKMSGGVVLEEIMKLDPRQPIVMMTAHGSMDVAKKMLLDGAVDFVTKPFRADELRRVCELATRREDYLVSNAQVSERMDNLRQLRNLLGNIVDSMPSVLVGVDLQGRVILWNQQAEELTGVESATAEGQLLVELWPEFDNFEEVQAALQQGEIRKLGKVHQHKNDKNFYCDITIYPLREAEVIGAVIRVDDVTERVLLEERIIQSEKMVSIGQLAAGMAHEINNPLAGVMQNVQVVVHRLSEHSKANLEAAEAAGLELESLQNYMQRRDIGARLDAVMEAGKRTVELVDNMVNFSRRDNTAMSVNNLADLIDKSIDLAAGNFNLKRKFDFKSILIEREYDSRVPLVECNPMQIQQVIFNILMNGAYSMEEKLQHLKEQGEGDYKPRFVLRTKYVDRRARIEIEDNGSGMDEEMQKHLFEPFYTTKRVGDGTGLGLSICYFIVTENHRGHLLVDSKPNVGSRFTLEFPQQTE